MTAALVLLRGWLGTAAGFVAKNPWICLCAVLALYGWQQHGRAEDWKERAAIEASNHRQTKANFTAAMAEAKDAWTKEINRAETAYAAAAQEADNANQESLAWRDRARAFADRGGVQSCRAGAGSAPGDTDASEGEAAAGSDGSGYVTLSRPDFDILTGNTDRLLRIHRWGEQLIEEGLAEKQ